MIKRLLNMGNDYISEMDWKDMALVKVCLCAIGVLLGLAVPKRSRKPALIGAVAVFLATYIPLMVKFLPWLADRIEEAQE